MPDISMCRNHVCENRHTCYRYMAIANPYKQAYGSFFSSADCTSYWHVDKGDRVLTVGAMKIIENNNKSRRG